MTEGFVYVLTSLNSDCVKIGGSDYPPPKRIREINGSDVYGALGPWTLFDLRQVTDWRGVERSLHRKFEPQRSFRHPGANELFEASPVAARRELEAVDPRLLIGQPAVDRMFGSADFVAYLRKLFVFAGLANWLDIQGAWTLSLFPSTGGGRYFTINVGNHEVAFTGLPDAQDRRSLHSLVVDALIFDFPDFVEWIESHDGEIADSPYASALPRAVSVMFRASFDEAERIFDFDGVRRALIAYWFESLLRLHQKKSSSMFARFHNYNAVSKIQSDIGSGLYRFN